MMLSLNHEHPGYDAEIEFDDGPKGVPFHVPDGKELDCTETFAYVWPDGSPYVDSPMVTKLSSESCVEVDEESGAQPLSPGLDPCTKPPAAEVLNLCKMTFCSRLFETVNVAYKSTSV